MISQARLREMFEYHDGDLIWRYDPRQRPQWNAQRAGLKAGCTSGKRYSQITIRPSKTNGLTKTTYLPTHRAVFAWHHGFFPEQVDHINGDRLDNRIENLRAATAFRNQMNRKSHDDTASGHKGVNKRKNGTWEVRISALGTRHRIGTFSTLEDALSAYKEAELTYHGEWRRVA